jgi:hypothetical protein
MEEKAMQSESGQAHWQNVYTKKGENEVSWFQENPAPSLELIAQVGATSASAIIDIGGGASSSAHRNSSAAVLCVRHCPPVICSTGVLGEN